MNFRRCILLLTFLFAFLFFNFGCLGIETPGELQVPELTDDAKAAIAVIDNLPSTIAGIERAKLSTIFNEKNFIDYFKEVGGENFELFIKNIGASEKAAKRYIKLFTDHAEFKNFVTQQGTFKEFMNLSKNPEFNKKFANFTKKSFDQALKDNPISAA